MNADREATDGLRFGVLTREGSPYGLELLRLLAAAGRRPVCIGVETVTWSSRWRRARLLARKTGAANAIYHNARIWSRVVASRFGEAPTSVDYRRFSPRVFVSDDVNGAPMRSFLAAHGLDLLVLGQSGILRRAVLAVPRLGTLNAHPGRLPAFRGVDVVKWTLLARDHPAVSLHWVDEGVDTGDVVEAREVPMTAFDEVADVEERAVTMSLALLAAAVERMAAGEELPRAPQRREAGRQYYLMPPWTERQLRRRWSATRAGLLSAAS